MVVNPVAGGGRGARVWERLLRDRPELARARVLRSEGAEAAPGALDRALDARPRRVLVLGGDGTVSLAADRLLTRAEASGEAPPPLGIVPAGTGGDLARSLGIPRAPGKALARALAGRPRPLDALEVTADDGSRRFAVNVVSAGLPGAVDEALGRRTRRGRATYLFAALAAFRRYRPVPCRLTVDGEAWGPGEDEPVLLVAVANGGAFGRGMRIAPPAVLDDGLLEIVRVRAFPGWQVPVQMARVYLGAHLGSRHVAHRQGTRVEIRPLGAFPPFDVDGDPVPAAALTVRILPGALRVLL